ncbi:MAG: hemerythrin domain-containing protein [Bauldia sp.]|nr:hemerythrin domain-containing protein [Bauldia sp.]
MTDARSFDRLDLDRRTGWPDELRFLLDRYPRDAWPAHANLGEMARFWLGIHDGFRNLGNALATGTLEFREGRLDPAAYRAWFQPRLSYFLSGLEGHHQIEDRQFFPLFGAAEPRLARGFAVLEQDHGAIHQAMLDVVGAANAFLQAPDADRDRSRAAADRCAEAGEALLAKLVHHLDDEEDLIIPLILDRGEPTLGI